MTGASTAAGHATSAMVRALRQRLGFSQARFAQAIQVHASTVSHWEHGHNQPSTRHVERLQAFMESCSAPLPTAAPRLQLVPLSRARAFAFIAEHHRHHRPPQGAKFAVGASFSGRLVGAATVGLPVARGLNDGLTLEVTRVATDGTRNAPSLLLAAAWRAARALGYHRMVTYTLPAESGASLRGAGWRVVAQTRGGSWSCSSRPRKDRHPLEPKLRWVVEERRHAR